MRSDYLVVQDITANTVSYDTIFYACLLDDEYNISHSRNKNPTSVRIEPTTLSWEASFYPLSQCGYCIFSIFLKYKYMFIASSTFHKLYLENGSDIFATSGSQDEASKCGIVFEMMLSVTPMTMRYQCRTQEKSMSTHWAKIRWLAMDQIGMSLCASSSAACAVYDDEL